MRLGVEVGSNIEFWHLKVICHMEIHAKSAILYMATRETSARSKSDKEKPALLLKKRKTAFYSKAADKT